MAPTIKLPVLLHRVYLKELSTYVQVSFHRQTRLFTKVNMQTQTSGERKATRLVSEDWNFLTEHMFIIGVEISSHNLAREAIKSRGALLEKEATPLLMNDKFI